MRHRRDILILAAALFGAGLLVSPSASALDKSIWGPIEFHAGHAACGGGGTAQPIVPGLPGAPVVPGVPSTPGTGSAGGRCSAFPLYRQLGVDTYQFQIPWESVARTRPANPRDPSDPAYNWPRSADFAVNQAGAHGIQLAALVRRTPAWANGGLPPIWAPTQASDYGDFLYAASRRYPTIRKWMIWGEPNRTPNFAPSGNAAAPRAYALILQAAYDALKSANLQNIVIGGMTVSGGEVAPPVWIRNMRLPDGRMPSMDWYGHNPFEFRFPRLAAKPIRQERGVSDIDTLWTEIQAAYGVETKQKKDKAKGKGKGKAKGKGKKAAVAVKKGKKRGKEKKRGKGGKGTTRAPTRLWLSEWTVPSDHAGVFPYFVSQAEQARWLTTGYQIAAKERYVEGLGWYRLDDYPETGSNPTWGLLTYEGGSKPALSAFAAVP